MTPPISDIYVELGERTAARLGSPRVQEVGMSLSKREFTAAELVPGVVYRVTWPFRDYDGDVHPVGESWRFISKSFLPYEDGLTLIVEKDGQEVWLRLQWRDDTQGPIISKFSDFVTEG